MIAVAVDAVLLLPAVWLIMANLTAPGACLLTSAVGFAMTVPLTVETT